MTLEAKIKQTLAENATLKKEMVELKEYQLIQLQALAVVYEEMQESMLMLLNKLGGTEEGGEI